LLHIILAGQVELQHRLESPFLRQLDQRISIRCRLGPLSKADTRRYIQHRLSIAGYNGNITFSPCAVREIFRHSQGIPRLINLICDRVLLAGYTEQTRHLKKHLVKKAVKSVNHEERVPSPGRNGFGKHSPQASVRVAWILGVVVVLALFMLTHLGTGSSSSVNVAPQALVLSQRVSENVSQNPVAQNIPVSTRELQDVLGAKVTSLDNHRDSGRKEIKETLYAKISPKMRILSPKGKKKWVEHKSMPDSKVRLEEKRLGDIRSHFDLAVHYQKRGERAKALGEYQKLLAIDPLNSKAYNNVGIIYKDMGELDRAIEEFKTALSLDPDRDNIHNNLGVAYFMQGNLQKAAVQCGKALKLNPDNVEATINLGIIYKKRNQVEEAKKMFGKILSLHPYCPEAHYNLGLILEESGDIRGAITHYQKFVDFSDNMHQELVGRVRMHLITLSQRTR